MPITVPGRKGDTVVERDEHPRDGVTAEKIARMKPVFREGGRVTAANASGITDGAAARLVTSEEAAERQGLQPAALPRDWQVVGVDPRIMGIGPVPACRELLKRNDLSFDDIDQVAEWLQCSPRA